MLKNSFYRDLPKHADFASLADPGSFTPLPDDWVLCCTDIVDSTSLIAQGKYKTVNMIGASVIAAMMNMLKDASFPYVFGGDGASFAVPADVSEDAHQVLSGLRIWVLREFGIQLRAAQFPMARIRAAGHDVTVARYAVSSEADYAMFAGGGLSWSEAQMKSGSSVVAADETAPAPDLTGLSCRWNNTPTRNGLILSLIINPPAAAEQEPAQATSTLDTQRPPRPGAYDDTIARVLHIVSGFERGGHPIPAEGPELSFPPKGLVTEAHMLRKAMPVALKTVQVFITSVIAWLLFRRRTPTGSFDPIHYLEQLSLNSDFRKFDDGLKMTLDCSPAQRDQLLNVLTKAQDQGSIRFGIHTQDEAMVTCIVPSATQDDHVHFVDGAAGGYTRAAQDLQRRARQG